jgi:hypothetical protein
MAQFPDTVKASDAALKKWGGRQGRETLGVYRPGRTPIEGFIKVALSSPHDLPFSATAHELVELTLDRFATAGELKMLAREAPKLRQSFRDYRNKVFGDDWTARQVSEVSQTELNAVAG